MKKEGYVSLWLGNFSSNKFFQDYLLTSYNENEMVLPTKFEKDFQIDYYDEDFIESDYFETGTTNIFTLLEGCSYDDTVIPNFINSKGKTLSCSFNSIILLYNFQYNLKNKNDLKYIKYFGSVKYK